MKATTQLSTVNGRLTKTETINYSDGSIVKRIYDRPQDIVPSDIIYIAFGPRVGKARRAK